jgi:leucyl/phenylalanyl-tRNA--protein transferase
MPVYLLTDDLIFPPVHLATPEGLLAVGGDLSPERLLLAYQSGIFPWYSEDEPILWWSPDPRLVLYPDELKISRSLRKTIRSGRFRVTMDTSFPQVIQSCGRTRVKNGQGTWITAEMEKAYIRLHRLGYGHSVEVWYGHDLVGGLYGISLGRCFFGESMFSTMNDASKVALVSLRNFIKCNEFEFIDCQMPTDHLIRLGAREIARDDYLSELYRSLQYPPLQGPWYYQESFAQKSENA